MPKSVRRIWRIADETHRTRSRHDRATWDQQGFVIYSSALKSVAIKLSKISVIDPAGIGTARRIVEINLPALQPGSSIMPGKVNPVVPEVMNLVAFRVMGNDFVITIAAHCGQLN